MGNVFFGVVGGEPFMHPHLIDMLAAHPDCYFQVFTNGQFITDAKAKELRRLGNVTPLISVEGNEIVSDERRGRAGVFSKTMAGVHNCLKNKVFTGVCTSLCQTNIDDLLDGEMGRSADRDGRAVHMVPRLSADGAGRQPAAVPDAGAAIAGAAVRRRRCGRRSRSSSWTPTSTARAGRSAPRRRASRTTSTRGATSSRAPSSSSRRSRSTSSEADPPFAARQVPQSEFLRDFRTLAQSTTRGCIVLERPDLLKQLVEKHGARDATVRGTALAELEAMEVRHVAVQPRQRGPREELDVSAGEALLVQRLRRLPRPRSQPDIGAGPASREEAASAEARHDLDSHRPAGGGRRRIEEGLRDPLWHVSGGVPHRQRGAAAAGREFSDSIVAAHSLLPEAMLHIFSAHAALIKPDMPLTRRQQEMIATVVSALNRCFY